MIKYATVLFLLLSFVLPAVAADDSEQFRQIYEKEWAFRLQQFPMFASWVGVHDYADQLGDVSEEAQAARNEFWKGIREELQAVSCQRLQREDCINYRIFIKQIDNFIADYETRSYLMPFNSDWGFYMELARLPKDASFSSLQDYRNYLGRLHQLPRVMDQYIALMRKGLELGITQPRVVLDGRDEPIKAQLVEAAEQSPFYSPFQSIPESVAGGEKAELLATAEQVISGGVIPAYQRLYDFFQEEYVPGARKTLGASALPGGERFYRSQISKYVTLDMGADEIHRIGREQVARIRGEMDSIIEEVDFEGDFAAFLEFLRTDEQFYAKTPKELLAFASYYAKKIDGRLPMIIGHLPRQPYGVAPVPEDIAPFYTAGRYVSSPLDSHRGGYYWVNTYDLPSRPLYAIPALTLHEGAPGHHTQGALAMEQAGQPPFRRYDYISAYGEGWGLYSEKLGLEMDIYETPYEHFGRLTYEMWRACRLVIDTGIHAMGWTREQARDFLASHTALSLHEVTTEIDRYISWPGQALSYKLGEYTIWKLRAGAEQDLGDAFDIRAFHDFILSLGSVPLDVLSEETAIWINEQQKKG
ncbi:MAG: DUF885 domain-containing protein [Xanthomonadales bacterium]|nr:DUF885 domain-containing protein [Gammaproteobacteria bacterium]MBT8054331.1 DUF885 domain-containing protein [Gammaproteobacteria bacterium]NND57476.1 DUF885 domain-containing protein [Xanthomonadales bacterium]NNK51200.1 DUF885 domain-containing protein [Xanthomonadales bacterium]